jgi:quercetin dioxygenase-like cupin family protein
MGIKQGEPDMQRYEVEDVLKLPGEGEKTATDMVIKARARDMGGDFSVMEGVIPPHSLLAPHTHKFEDQLVYVISGELEFEVGGADGLRFKAPAGSYIQKPRGIMHTFWNPTDTPARYVELSGREGFEGFVDSKRRGELASTLNAERDWGMITHIDEIPRLMRDNELTGLAMSETPNINEFPQLPEPVAKLLDKLFG